MGKMKVPEPSASPSFLSLPGQGGGEYSVGLKANLIRSRTQGPEECCSPLPSLPGELPGNSHWFCQRRFRFRLSVSHCFSVLFKRRVDWQQLCRRSSRALSSCLPWTPWVSTEHPLCDAGYLVAPLCLLYICDKISLCNPGWSLCLSP